MAFPIAAGIGLSILYILRLRHDVATTVASLRYIASSATCYLVIVMLWAVFNSSINRVILFLL